MIIRWQPIAYSGHAAYQEAIFSRAWLPSVAAFTAIPAPGGGITHYLLLLGVGR